MIFLPRLDYPLVPQWSDEQLIIAYYEAKNVAVNDFAKMHAKLFNSVSPHINRISVILMNEIKPLLNELKKIFPIYSFFIMPMTHTYGNDIAPMYEARIDTRWFVFYIDENHKAYGISNLVVDEYPELSEKLNNLDNKVFLKLNIALETLIPPDKAHLEVMLSHKMFK